MHNRRDLLVGATVSKPDYCAMSDGARALPPGSERSLSTGTARNGIWCRAPTSKEWISPGRTTWPQSPPHPAQPVA